MRCVYSKAGHKNCERRQGYSKRRPLAPVRGLGTASALSTALLTLAVGIGATPAAAATCASLAGLMLPETTITAAESVPAGTYKAPNGQVFTDLPAFCRIAATLTPTSDSNIKIEVWMPYSGWNGRYLGTGNGGFGGVVYGTLAIYLARNYAVANTDQGTSPAATDPLGPRVLTGHPEKQIDFGTRSTNLMTVRSKQIIEAFYGEPSKYSYFAGCSGGGGNAVHEALQFPGDYDGIVAGAPFMNETHLNAGHVWNSQAFDGPANITAAQATAITAAVVKECAGKDGGSSSDNFLTDPRDCHWDPAALQCTGGAADAATCLTAPQVAAMRKFYQGPINSRTGERILAGRVRGSETNSGYPAALATRGPSTAFQYWVFGNNFDWRTFDFDQEMDAIDDALAARLNANTADLEEFESHGGKLILTHGFADPVLPTLNTVAYYERLIASQTHEGRLDERKRKEALRRTQEFARLFLFPGVAHCGGGAGPGTLQGDTLPTGAGTGNNTIERIALDPLVQWVEHGIAPDQIIAYHVTNGVTDLSRPICPYPELPRYKGVGDPTKASSFACVTDGDRDDNQPPAPKYLDDGDNFPLVPITPTDDHDKH
jgi:feruloyl esterase